jgi:hypothetical protein
VTAFSGGEQRARTEPTEALQLPWRIVLRLGPPETPQKRGCCGVAVPGGGKRKSGRCSRRVAAKVGSAGDGRGATSALNQARAGARGPPDHTDLPIGLRLRLGAVHCVHHRLPCLHHPVVERVQHAPEEPRQWSVSQMARRASPISPVRSDTIGSGSPNTVTVQWEWPVPGAPISRIAHLAPH